MRATVLLAGLVACALCRLEGGGVSLAAGGPITVAGTGQTLTPPQPESPIDYFRRLLAMSGTERRQALAAKPKSVRQGLERKLAEYDVLDPADREFRLRALEVRWELLLLMKTDRARRPSLLQALPEADRPFISFRLQQWDALPPATQHSILENEVTVRYFLRLESSTPASRQQARQGLPPEVRQQLDERLARWREVPRDQRERMLDRFTQFFALTGEEREHILSLLTEPQRRQTQHFLQRLDHLPPSRRELVLESLRKFADMTPSQRGQFLRNAARWEALPSKERVAWLNLVQQLPPLPPGLQPAPPLPPGLRPPPPPAAR